MSTYSKLIRELDLDRHSPLKAAGHPLVGPTMTTTTTIAIGVGRRPRHQRLLSKVDLRNGDGGGDLDLRVGLRTVVDGGSRHCDGEGGLLGKSCVKRLM